MTIQALTPAVEPNTLVAVDNLRHLYDRGVVLDGISLGFETARSLLSSGGQDAESRRYCASSPGSCPRPAATYRSMGNMSMDLQMASPWSSRASPCSPG